MVYYPEPVKIPVDSKRVVKNRKGGTVYVEYTVSAEYDPGTKKNVIARCCIGKVTEEDGSMMYPNEKYYSYFPPAPGEGGVRRPDRRDPEMRVGSFLLLQKIALDEGLADILRRLLGDDAGLFLDIASYMVIKESNVMQFYESFAARHPQFSRKQRIYSDSTISNFFRKIGEEGIRAGFLSEWNARTDKTEKIYVSYDSTNKRCQAGDVEISEFGGNPKQGKGPTYNIELAYDHTDEEPLFYSDYSGTVIDMSQLQTMLEKAKDYGYENVGFILDRGYFSRGNIRYMEEKGISYVIMVKGMKKWIRGLVDDNYGTFERSGAYRIYEKGINAKTVHAEVHNFAVGERWCHLYFSAEHMLTDSRDADKEWTAARRALEGLKFEKHAEEKWGRYADMFDLDLAVDDDGSKVLIDFRENPKALEESYRYCGYFVIITSEEMTSEEAYILYKSRDEVEKLFRADKGFAPCERVASSDSLEGKQLVEFVALILYDHMMTRLSKACTDSLTHPNYFTVPGALNETEKISMLLIGDKSYRLESALSKEQKDILKVFGIDENYIKKHAQNISDIYSGKTEGSLLKPLTDKNKARKAS